MELSDGRVININHVVQVSEDGQSIRFSNGDYLTITRDDGRNIRDTLVRQYHTMRLQLMVHTER